MNKLFKKDTKQFLNTLHKLTDQRFSFNIVRSFENDVMGYNLETSFCGNYIASYILEQNDISIDGLCDNVVSYCQYDCYYDVNLKGV